MFFFPTSINLQTKTEQLMNDAAVANNQNVQQYFRSIKESLLYFVGILKGFKIIEFEDSVQTRIFKGDQVIVQNMVSWLYDQLQIKSSISNR